METNTDRYVSLNTHSSWSIGQALSTPKELFKKAEELGQKAVCITDSDTMAGMWDSLKLSKETGIKFIAGCEFNLVDSLEGDDTRLRKIVLIAKNGKGYTNLLALRKFGSDQYIVARNRSYSRITWDLLTKHSEGLICLTGDGNGYVPQLIMEDRLSEAGIAIKKFKGIFGDNFALQLMPNNLQIRSNPYSGDVDQRKINLSLKKFHDAIGVKCIVATGSYYLEQEHHDSQDVLLAISAGQPVYSGQRLKFDKKDFYVKSEDEVRLYFSRHKKLWPQEFVDSMFDNVEAFVESCETPEWIDPKHTNPSGKELPEFPITDQYNFADFSEWKQGYKENHLADDVLYYRYLVELGLKEKINAGKLKEDDMEMFREQIAEELDVLEYHGFSSYMLIVWDYINWCKRNDIPVGPGRGSVGGCFTAYLVGIHEADPFKYGLIFSRFHNKEKSSFPDIDTDFSPAGRDRLHAYIREKYGEEYIAHVSNINTITPKVYARDISRVFEFGDDGRSTAADIGDDIADSISSEYSRVTTALAQAPLFQEYAKQYPELAEHSILGGKARAWSTHAAGLVIGMRPLHEIVPVRRDPHGALCLEYEKERSEDNGLVKMDTLGLETLDIIKRTYEIIREVGKTPPAEPFDYDQYDEKTYNLISEGDTFCVFQLTGVAAPVCKMLQPKSVEDIALVTALIRPAAKAIINDFMKVRSGEKELELMHPTLERALKSTYGFGLYEECLMFIAADVAGWDLHKADGLRKMTKNKGKYPEKVAALRASFIEDAQVNKGVEEKDATQIWDEIVAGFGGYGFNRSHAVLYSMISFHTAYLKANFPLEFLVSNLMAKVSSNNPKAKDEVIKIKQEIRALGVRIVPPDVNTSDFAYKIIDDKTLMTGLDALRNVKEGAIEEIKTKRPFKNYKDIIERTDTTKVRSPVIQALAASGALDDFGMRREHMFFYCSDYRKKLQALKTSLSKKVEKGKITFEEAQAEVSAFEYPFPEDEKTWKPFEVFALEEHFLGEGITGSFQDRFPKFFDRQVTDISSLPETIDYMEYSDDEKENRRANTHNIENHGITGLKGIITNLFEFKVKKEDSKIFGQVMARITVQDPFDNTLDIICFPNSWEAAKERVEKELSGGKGEMKEGIAIYFNGSFQWENEHTYSFILGDILSYKDSPKVPKSLKSKSVKIPRKTKVKKDDVKELKKEDLAEALEDELLFEGKTPVDEDDEFNFR